MGLILVLAIRLSVPLAILRWPFAGSLLALAVDVADIVIFQLTDFPAVPYQRFDKILDVYYVVLQAAVVQRWAPSMRWIANALCAYRLIGTVVYELTDARVLLLVFPNVFTFWFMFCTGVMVFRADYEFTTQRILRWLPVVLIPTLALEYALHYAKWFDDLVADDIVEDAAGGVWRWLRDLLL